MCPLSITVSCIDTSNWHQRPMCSQTAATAAEGNHRLPTVPPGRVHQHRIQLSQASCTPPNLALPMALTSHPRVHPQGVLQQFTTSVEGQQLPQTNPCLPTDRWPWRSEHRVRLKTATHPCPAI